MVIIALKNGQRAEVQTGASVEAGTFPSETGSNPIPSLIVKNAAGEPVATFRTAEVAWFANEGAVAIA